MMFVLETLGIGILAYLILAGLAMGIVMLIEWGNTKQVENYKKKDFKFGYYEDNKKK